MRGWISWVACMMQSGAQQIEAELEANRRASVLSNVQMGWRRLNALLPGRESRLRHGWRKLVFCATEAQHSLAMRRQLALGHVKMGVDILSRKMTAQRQLAQNGVVVAFHVWALVRAIARGDPTVCLDVVVWRGTSFAIGRSMRRDYSEQQRRAEWDKRNRLRWLKLYTNFMMALLEAKERRSKAHIERRELDHRDSPAMRYHFHKNVPATEMRPNEHVKQAHHHHMHRGHAQAEAKESTNPFDIDSPASKRVLKDIW